MMDHMNSKPLRIMIVDDHEVVRMGLRALLEQHGAIEVVGEAATSAEAVMHALALQPDIVLMDVRLPEESGIEACRQIRAIDPGIRVLMLTSYANDEAIFASIMAGASGYLLKRLKAGQLYKAVIAVGQGESLLDPSLSKAVLERVKELGDGRPDRGFDSLSEKEKDILKLISDGLTNKEIAAEVCLSEKTVRNYITSIFQKLDVAHRTQAAVYYLEKKPVSEE